MNPNQRNCSLYSYKQKKKFTKKNMKINKTNITDSDKLSPIPKVIKSQFGLISKNI